MADPGSRQHNAHVTETPDWRRCRWEATHRRILTTALELFEDFGYEQVSVSQLASRSGSLVMSRVR